MQKKKKERKKENAICVDENLMCHIKMFKRKINKLTQYLKACFCYCHSGHLSNPFSKLLYDVVCFCPGFDLVWRRQSFINAVLN